MSDIHEINLTGLRDLAPDVIDADGLPRVMPAAFYAATRPEERAWLAIRHGLYGLPTVELVDWLRARVDGRSAIEIGAGHGRLADALDIRATDNRMQEWPAIRMIYDLQGQPPVTYGPNVETVDANRAVRRYKPDVVVGSWVTHRYNPRRHSRGGNEHGPDLPAILAEVDELILVVNEKTHAKNPLMDVPHETYTPPGLYSRALTGAPDQVAVWKGTRR